MEEAKIPKGTFSRKKKLQLTAIPSYHVPIIIPSDDVMFTEESTGYIIVLLAKNKIDAIEMGKIISHARRAYTTFHQHDVSIEDEAISIRGSLEELLAVTHHLGALRHIHIKKHNELRQKIEELLELDSDIESIESSSSDSRSRSSSLTL